MKVTCACGQGFNVPDDAGGKQFRCPKCSLVVQVGAPGEESLPIALDRPPSRGRLPGRRSEPAEGLPLAKSADAGPQSPKATAPDVPSDLIVAVSQANGDRPSQESGLPLATSKPPAKRAATKPAAPPKPEDLAPPAGPSHEEAAANLGDLAAALNGEAAAPRPSPKAGAVRPKAVKPVRVGGAAKPAARKGKSGVAVARGAENGEGAKRKRDLLPIIVSGAAVVVLVAVLVGVIVIKNSGPSSGTKGNNAAAEAIPNTSTDLAAPRQPAGYDFFGNVPDQTSEDYYKRKQEKKQNGE